MRSLQDDSTNRLNEITRWKDLEFYVRSLQDDSTNRLNEITGPIFSTSGDSLTVTPCDREPAIVPSGFFKVIVYVNSQNALEVRCFIIYQDAKCLNDRDGVVDHKRYQVPIGEIEKLTGLVFDPIYHETNVIVDDDDALPQGGTDPNIQKSGIFIAAAMVDPAGKDSGHEWISIINHDEEQNTINLHGWKLVDQKGRTLVLEEEMMIEPGLCVKIQPISPLRLVNTSGALTLFNPSGERVDRIKYTKDQVKEGVAVDLLMKRNEL